MLTKVVDDADLVGGRCGCIWGRSDIGGGWWSRTKSTMSFVVKKLQEKSIKLPTLRYHHQ